MQGDDGNNGLDGSPGLPVRYYNATFHGCIFPYIYVSTVLISNTNKHYTPSCMSCCRQLLLLCKQNDLLLLAFREIQVMQVQLDFKDHKDLLESLGFHRDQRYSQWFGSE